MISSQRFERSRNTLERALLLGLALIGLLPTTASGAGRERVDRAGSGFSPYFTAAPHVTIQKVRARVDSSFEASGNAQNVLTSMAFQFTGGLLGPALVDLPGQPRPLVFGGLILPINESSVIGSRVENVDIGPANLKTDTKFSVEYQTSASVGLGLEFVWSIFDVDLIITPGVQYVHLRSRYVGDVETVLNPDNPTQPLEETRARTKRPLAQHLAGPTLRLETPRFEFWMLGVDFFLEGSVLLDLAGTREHVQVRTVDGETASFNFEAGSGAGQVTTGLRIQWR